MSYKSSRERKRRLKKIYSETKYKYGPGVYFNERKNRLCKIDFSGDGKRFLKKQNSKTTRRKHKRSFEPCKKCKLYKKDFDYMWELF